MKQHYTRCSRLGLLLVTVLSVLMPGRPAHALVNSNLVAISQVLLASDFEERTFFGNGLATSGDTAVIGAPGLGIDFFNELSHGRAYVFGFTGSNWVQQQEFAPTNVLNFGTSAAIDGNLFVIGAPGGQMASDIFPGRAVVYAKIGTTWVRQQDLAVAGIGPADEFGNSVAISGQTIAVGAPSHTNNGVGAVYVFVQNGTTWIQQAELSSPQGTGFGASVALQGDTLIASSGAKVFIYNRTGTTWSIQQVITLPNGSAANRAVQDNTISLSGDLAVFGAPNNGGGEAYLYRRTGSTWSLVQQLVPTIDPFSIQEFGAAVAIANNEIFVGAPLSFVLHVFENVLGTWTDVQRIANPVFPADGETIFGVGFGDPIAVGPHGVLVGAPGAETVPNGGISQLAGAVYFLTNAQAPESITITSATASPAVLWPPNHKLIPVTISVTTSIIPATCRIISVTSNQPINGKGDGNTSPDWTITGDLTVLLRAERAGNIKTDRVYTVTVECADTFGNTARTSVTVTVPHDQGK